MSSHDYRTNKIIEQLIDKKFFFETVDASVQQDSNNDPLIMLGSGSIAQDDTGILRFNFKNDGEGWPKQLVKFAAGGLKTAQLIPNEQYLTARVKDEYGSNWILSRLKINKLNLALNAVSNHTIHNLSMVESVDSLAKSNAKIIILGKYDIPSNDSILETDRGKEASIDLSRFSYKSMEITIKHRNDFLEISVNGQLDNDSFVHRLLQALSIYTGINLKPIFIESQDGAQICRNIYSHPHDLNFFKLLPPLSYLGQHSYNDFVNFTTRYLDTFDSESTSFFGYWHKAYIARQASIETMSLSLSVVIEGVIKTYFLAYGAPSPNLLESAKVAKAIIIENKEIPKLMVDRLRNAVANATHPSVSAAVKKISDKLSSEVDYKKAWTELRNSTAHADELDRSFNSIDKHVTQTFQCLTFFYRLLFFKIGYCGRYISYPGQPFKLDYTSVIE